MWSQVYSSRGGQFLGSAEEPAYHSAQSESGFSGAELAFSLVRSPEWPPILPTAFRIARESTHLHASHEPHHKPKMRITSEATPLNVKIAITWLGSRRLTPAIRRGAPANAHNPDNRYQICVSADPSSFWTWTVRQATIMLPDPSRKACLAFRPTTVREKMQSNSDSRAHSAPVSIINMPPTARSCIQKEDSESGSRTKSSSLPPCPHRRP